MDLISGGTLEGALKDGHGMGLGAYLSSLECCGHWHWHCRTPRAGSTGTLNRQTFFCGIRCVGRRWSSETGRAAWWGDEGMDARAPASSAVGTAGYMPPELFLGEDEEGHGWAVDMFALGATVFEMVTGAGMFRSEGDLHFRVLWRVGEGVGEVDWSHGAWSSPVGSKLRDLITRLVSPTPSDRPSAQATTAEVKQLGREVNAKTRHRLVRKRLAAPGPPAPTPAPSPAPTPPLPAPTPAPVPTPSPRPPLAPSPPPSPSPSLPAVLAHTPAPATNPSSPVIIEEVTTTVVLTYDSVGLAAPDHTASADEVLVVGWMYTGFPSLYRREQWSRPPPPTIRIDYADSISVPETPPLPSLIDDASIKPSFESEVVATPAPGSPIPDSEPEQQRAFGKRSTMKVKLGKGKEKVKGFGRKFIGAFRR